VDAIPGDAAELRAAYQRLTDKFRTLWVFQHFSRARRRPPRRGRRTSAAFTPLYEQIKKVRKGARPGRRTSCSTR